MSENGNNVTFEAVKEATEGDDRALAVHTRLMVAAVEEAWQNATLLGTPIVQLVMRAEDLMILGTVLELSEDGPPPTINGRPIVVLAPGEATRSASLIVCRYEDATYLEMIGVEDELLCLHPGETMLHVNEPVCVPRSD